MKIIATVGDGTFIAKLNYQEIDYLAGETIGDSSGYYSSDRKIRSGTEFNIVKAFQQIHRNNQRKGEVDTVKKTLQAVLAGLDMIGPLIEEPDQREISKEVHS